MEMYVLKMSLVISKKAISNINFEKLLLSA